MSIGFPPSQKEKAFIIDQLREKIERRPPEWRKGTAKFDGYHTDVDASGKFRSVYYEHDGETFYFDVKPGK